MRTVGNIKSENSKGFTIFELVRKQSCGGGLATLVKPDLNPVWISEGDDFTEILVVQVHIKELCIRVINCYGPQETDSIERKTVFWARLHTEVNNALEANCGIIVQMDGGYVICAWNPANVGNPNLRCCQKPGNVRSLIFSLWLDS